MARIDGSIGNQSRRGIICLDLCRFVRQVTGHVLPEYRKVVIRHSRAKQVVPILETRSKRRGTSARLTVVYYEAPSTIYKREPVPGTLEEAAPLDFALSRSSSPSLFSFG